jgi:sec-independent protein translocase protein TatA
MFEGIMQPMHLLVILMIALLFFGPSKLAGLGKGLGDGIRGFKDALKETAPGSDSTDSSK